MNLGSSRPLAGGHGHSHVAHGHSHGLIDRSITQSHDGLGTVAITLTVLLITAVLQLVIFITTGSVALLADLIHNFGDALTAIPLAIAFFMRSFVAEKRLSRHGCGQCHLILRACSSCGR
jgi:Co/Zn/Cd efflux system component